MAAGDSRDRTSGDQVSGVKGVHVNSYSVQVVGDGLTAETLRGYLRQLGYRVAETGSAYVVRVEEGSRDRIALEGVRGPFAEEALHAIAELSGAVVEWRTAGAGSERELRVVVSDATSDAGDPWWYEVSPYNSTYPFTPCAYRYDYNQLLNEHRH